MNPFGNEKNEIAVATEENVSMMNVQSQKEVAEIQAQMVIAQKFPRNEKKACDKIINACSRPSLAEKALYQYARGGTDVSGLSIRMAEALAIAWKNIKFGVEELERKSKESICEAFAIDLEANVKVSKKFVVRHFRETKRGSYKLESDRDIGELIANQGARKVRACILALIPADVQEVAIQTVHSTLKSAVEITPEKIKGMVDAFKPFGVTKEMLEARIQRRLDTITPALMVNLGKIYNSLKDGMSQPSEWFEMPTTEKKVAKKGKEALKDAIK